MAEYLKKLREQNSAVSGKEKERGTGYAWNYKPGPKDRKLIRDVTDRFRRMRDDPIRKEAEEDWDRGDKYYRLWRPKRDEDDWRADIRLPDAFAAIATHLQETIGMKIRPGLKPHEGSDTGLAFWANSIMGYNMDRTDYDLESIRAFLCSATKGTAFTAEWYLFESRDVRDPDDVVNGVIKYVKREIIDKDDTYTIHWANERVFVDENATRIEEAEDCILEERLRIDTFNLKYGDNEDFYNTDKVIPCGSMSTRNQFFDRSDDDPMDGDYVQVLHYYNKLKDQYIVLANTVVVRDSPIPFKHKELPIAVWNYYPVEGRIYGMGIPKIIAPTQEEREAIRNLSLDRQKMHLNKMFIVSDMFELDEDEATTRPHGFIHVNSGGTPLDNIIKPIEYGDVPGSSIRMDDQLRDDEKRVTGIDDRSQGVNMGGTATEAAILTENSQKRINLINTLTGMATIKRIGMLKWSNIQFFYPAPRIERLMQDNEERERKVYRKVNVDGMEFKVVLGEGRRKEIQMNEITGSSSFKLDRTHARFLEHDYDIRVDWDIKSLMPQAIRQAKAMEVFNGMLANPQTMANLDVRNAMKDIMMEYGIDPRRWMTNKARSKEDMMALASWENAVMMKGLPLDPTYQATEDHTLVHLWFTETDDYKNAPTAVKMIFDRHIKGENMNGPGGAATGGMAGPGNAGMPDLAEIAAVAASGGGGAPGTSEMNVNTNPSAAAPTAPPVTPIVNGGAVTQDVAPQL